MVQLNFAWHIYMRAFCPQIKALGFVDNSAPVAFQVDQLAAGLVCLVEFFKLWNLATEAAKSCCCGTTTSLRGQLRAFPFRCVESAHELGGILSFTKKPSAGLQEKRHMALEKQWHALQKSWAPGHQKLASMPLVLWASALHGIYGTERSMWNIFANVLYLPFDFVKLVLIHSFGSRCLSQNLSLNFGAPNKFSWPCTVLP